MTDPRVLFLSRGRGYTHFITANEMVLTLSGGAGKNPEIQSRFPIWPAAVSRFVFGAGAVDALSRGSDYPDFSSSGRTIRMELVGSNPHPQVEGLDLLPGQSNYFTGSDPSKWRRHVPQYAQVRLKDVYPGIDLVYHGEEAGGDKAERSMGRLEYDFVLKPGANPKTIRWACSGMEDCEVQDGNLVFHTSPENMVFRAPVVYQSQGGVEKQVTGRYVLKGGNQVCFEVEGYDPTQTLVIDPTLDYSTYLGGTSSEAVYGMAVDPSGFVYITGPTSSTNFPTTSGSFQTVNKNQYAGDVFVTKVNQTGTGLVYSTYIGDIGGEYGQGIAVDSSGNAYVTGATSSGAFPTTAGAYKTTHSGTDEELFVLKLDPMGSNLIYSTFLGGSGDEHPGGIAVDSGGCAYITGTTFSSDFPATGGGQATFQGAQDAFVTKVNPTGTGLVYSTFLGGSNADFGYRIAVDGSGNAFVCGLTASPDFPTTGGAYQTFRGIDDGFVTKVDPTGAGFVFSTCLGGSDFDSCYGIALDIAGNACVVGATASSDFPVSAGSFQGDQGVYDAFVTRLNATGTGIDASTYLGGSDVEYGLSIATDSSSNLYVVGYTRSADFPTTGDSYQKTQGGMDATLSILDPTMKNLLYSTYLGGNNTEEAHAMGLDALGNIYVGGNTFSTNFPITAGAFQTSLVHSGDCFVMKFSALAVTPLPTATYTATVDPSAPTSTPSSTGTFTGVPTETLTTTSTWTPTPTSTVTQTLTVTLTPTDSSTWTPMWTPTATMTITPTPTETQAITSTPTWTLSPIMTLSPSSTQTPTGTSTWTSTATKTTTPTPTEMQAITSTPTWTLSPIMTLSPSSTQTPTWTPTWTSTATKTITSTPTETRTITSTPTWTFSPIVTLSPSSTQTPTWTPTWTSTATKTITSTPTETQTITSTFTRTSTPTMTYTATLSFTRTNSPTPTSSPTPMPSSTPTWTNTVCGFCTPIATDSETPSPKYSPSPTPSWTPMALSLGCNKLIVSMNVFHPLFGETLSVRVELCKANWFSFNIYNTAGERVRSLKPGGPGDAYSSEEQHMVWDGKNDRGEWVSSGVYILYGEGGRFSDRRLVVLLR